VPLDHAEPSRQLAWLIELRKRDRSSRLGIGTAGDQLADVIVEMLRQLFDDLRFPLGPKLQRRQPIRQFPTPARHGRPFDGGPIYCYVTYENAMAVGDDEVRVKIWCRA
jgi:hypothetical protein